MDTLFSDLLLRLLMVSMTFSVILMALIQKFKTSPFIKKTWQVWLLNFFCSFVVGIPFGSTFYNLTIADGIWVGIFSFIGAPTIYETLKKQQLINYKPTSLSDKVVNNTEISKDDT